MDVSRKGADQRAGNETSDSADRREEASFDFQGDCRRIRSTSNVPIIVLSAASEERSKVDAFDSGAGDYILKPFGTAELRARVRAVLRRGSMTCVRSDASRRLSHPRQTLRRPPPMSKGVERAQRVRALLSQKGTNLHRVSAITKHPPYGAGTPFVIPHWFYSELGRGGTPHICQIVALSEITGVRLEDWMAVFGYRLDDVPRLQLGLASPRPVLVNAVVNNAESRGSPFSTDDERYAYIKTSDIDGSLYPRVGAGSMLRIDRRRTAHGGTGPGPQPVFAIQWRAGPLVTFLKLAPGHSDVVVLPPRYPASEQIVGRDLTILGTADWEFRPLSDRRLQAAGLQGPPPRRRSGIRVTAPGFGATLRESRERAGLNYRAAHELTVQVSTLQDDPRYAISQSSLFSYELSNTLPRHVAKLISLCAVYAVSLWTLLDSAGVHVEPHTGDPVCAQIRGSNVGDQRDSSAITHRRASAEILSGVPAPLYEAIPALVDQGTFSFGDVHVCGRRLRALNPLFQGAVFLTVDRRQRSVAKVNARAKFRRPMFLVQESSGEFLSGVCSVDRGVLTVQPRLQAPAILARFPARDADVIGRITGVMRRLDPDAEPASRPVAS
jgi:CheY-like chemotaxis protein